MLEAFTRLGTLPLPRTHSGASLLLGKDSVLTVGKIEESDTPFFSNRHSTMATRCLLPKYQNKYLRVWAINTISFLVRP